MFVRFLGKLRGMTQKPKWLLLELPDRLLSAAGFLQTLCGVDNTVPHLANKEPIGRATEICGLKREISATVGSMATRFGVLPTHSSSVQGV